MDTAQYILTQLIGIPSSIKVVLLFVYFLYGCIIGSFLNVCIIRIPKGESIIRPGSHCKCGKPIKWYDNIPVVSWLVLRGKSRCCHSHIPAAYPLVEAFVGLQWMLGGMCVLYIPHVVSLLLMGGICVFGPIVTYFLAVKFHIFK